MEFFKKAKFEPEVLELYRSYNKEHYNPLLESYIEKFTGEGDLPACLRIFNSLMLINGVFSLFGVVFYSLNGIDKAYLMILICSSMLSFIAYYLCHDKCRFGQAAALAMLSIYGSLGHLYFMFGGVSCAFLISFLVFHLNFLFIIRPARHLGFTILNLILIFICFFIQFTNPDAFVTTSYNTSFILLANVFSTIYAAFVLYIGMYIMKRESDSLRIGAEEQAESLREVARIQNQMISIISHDVRSPLANIEQMLQMIHSDMIPETKRGEFNKQLLNSTRQTREILESMVTWTRAQVSDLGVNDAMNTICDLDVVLRKELEDWEEVALQKEIQLSYLADCTLPALVRADQNLAKTILRNLVLNAIKFTPQKGRVSICISETEKTIQLIVSDDGIGMTLIQKETLFKGRLTSKRGTNGEKGSGLGLWIIADMLQRVQGSITVESELNEGSTFIASIPKATL